MKNRLLLSHVHECQAHKIHEYRNTDQKWKIEERVRAAIAQKQASGSGDYVVVRCHTGWGDFLLSLIAAWYHAKIARLFLCTDTAAVEKKILEHFPQALARKNIFVKVVVAGCTI